MNVKVNFLSAFIASKQTLYSSALLLQKTTDNALYQVDNSKETRTIDYTICTTNYAVKKTVVKETEVCVNTALVV